MACPLSHILNPTDEESQPNAPSGAQNAGANQTSLSNTNMAAPSDAKSHKHKTSRDDSWGDVVLSPQEGNFNHHEASTSRRQLPPMLSPLPEHVNPWLEDVTKPDEQADTRPRGIFNLLLNHPELIYEMTRNLDVEDLISLYAISKDFHLLFNRHYTAFILGQSVGKASESSKTFTYRSYRNLCIRDPARRPLQIVDNEIRWVPSFKWLRMILFREAVVDDIVRSLYYEGHRLPKRASLAIKKIWFTLDVPDNRRRIALMHNHQFWTSQDLFVATMFIVKLDMRLTCPVSGNGETLLRRMLLNQRSLSTLARVLRREELKNQLDLLRMIVRYSYVPGRPPKNSVLGVPPHEVGRLSYEGWGRGRVKFLGVDHLIAGESCKRELNLGASYIDFVLYGYIRKTGDVWEDIMTPEDPGKGNERYARYLMEDEEGDYDSGSDSSNWDESELGDLEVFDEDDEGEEGSEGEDSDEVEDEDGGEDMDEDEDEDMEDETTQPG